MGKLLGLDIGEKRIGYAVSDVSQSMAFPRGFFLRSPLKGALAFLKKLIEEEKIEEVAIGLPLDEENKETEQTDRIKKFGQLLRQELGVRIVYLDESNSTNEARAKIPFRADRVKKVGYVDAVSAQIILERYIEAAR